MNDLINGREMLKRYQEDLCYGIACKECSMCTEDGGCRVEEWIDKFPSADRPQGWIPCSERTPTKAGHYLCSFNKPNRIDNIYVDLAYWTGSRWYGYLANEINAWMPLPKPWKGADDE